MAVQSAQWYIEHNMNANSAVGNYSNDCIRAGVVEDAQVKRDINNGRNFGSALNRGGNNNSGPLTPLQQIQEAGRGKSNISDSIETNQFDYAGMTSRTGATMAFQTEILKQLKIESDLHTEINERMGITGDLSKGNVEIDVEGILAGIDPEGFHTMQALIMFLSNARKHADNETEMSVESCEIFHPMLWSIYISIFKDEYLDSVLKLVEDKLDQIKISNN